MTTSVAKPGDVSVEYESGALDYDSGPGARRLHAEFLIPFVVLGPSAAENLLVYHADRAIEIVRGRAVVRGQTSPSVTWNMKHATDRTATGEQVFEDNVVTTATTTPASTDATGYNQLAAGEVLWFVSSATAGSVDALEVALVARLRTDV